MCHNFVKSLVMIAMAVLVLKCDPYMRLVLSVMVLLPPPPLLHAALTAYMLMLHDDTIRRHCELPLE